MKFAMKHGGLCSMSLFCVYVHVLYSCVHGWRFFARVRVMQAKSVTQVLRKALTFYSLVLEQMPTSLEGQPVMRKGYNPQMDFAYDEHDDVDIDENYVGAYAVKPQKNLKQCSDQQNSM